MKIKRVIRWAALLVALPALLLSVSGVVSASAATTASSSAGTGWVRLAHLSPNTPAVDVYLYSYGDSSAMQVLHHVSYGTVSSYESIAVGDYTVEMRAAGAAASSKPVLSASLDVVKDGSYTVVGLGPESGLRLEVLKDQLATSSGQSEVRIIQASLKQPKVSVTWHGHPTVSDLPFGQVSAYQAVAPATATLHISGSSESATSTVTLTAGTVHTLVVLDGAKGLTLDNFTDAAGSGSAEVPSAWPTPAPTAAANSICTSPTRDEAAPAR